MSRKNNRIQTLVRLDYENFILMKTRLTAPGQDAPAYGAMSDFINEVLRQHFTQKATDGNAQSAT